MPIVPSGRIRLMEKQALGPDDIKKFEPKGVQGVPEPAPRDDIEQQQIGAGQDTTPQGAAPEQAQPQQAEGQPGEQPQDPAAQQPQGGHPDHPGQQQPKEEISKVNTAKMKEHYFQVMNAAGVPVRQLDPENRNKLFTRGGSQDGTVQGTFYIPTYLSDGRQLHDDEAFQLAKKVVGPFGGVQIKGWNEVKGGYRYDWHNKTERATGLTGTSFDELFGNQGGAGGGAGGSGGQSGGGASGGMARAAANTMGEMLTARRQELYETMRRIAGPTE